MTIRISAFILCLFLMADLLPAQSNYYFPPVDGPEWTTKTPAELGWCPEKLDSLQTFLADRHTRSFLVLHEGRIVLEYYFGDADADSYWYLASAGKSITGFLTGMAQEEGLLDIQEPTSTYLGEGWTIAPPEKEDLITIWHQITMTSGLDDMIEVPGVPDPANCLDPECLDYLEDAGTRWAYHNAPYRLMLDILEAASGQTINQFTGTALNQRIGTSLFWLDYVCWGRARDAARFGLTVLNNGVWDSDTLLSDADYFQAMLTPSQEYNRSYGYLWWLNGQESFMLPGLPLVFPDALIPAAPDDLVAALGLNDQKIYVVPSLDMVVVRQGDAAGDAAAGPSSFDNQLWERIMDLECVTTTLEQVDDAQDWKVFPQPAFDFLTVEGPTMPHQLQLTDMHGSMLRTATGNQLPIHGLAAGIYLLEITTSREKFFRKVVIGDQ